MCGKNEASPCPQRRCGAVRFLGVAAAGLAAVLTAGCSTLTGEREVHQFEPMPLASVGAQDLEPAAPPSMTDLLRAAGDAFELANAAQERGEHGAALRKYTLMLELLTEASPDPAIFYDLRGAFEHILTTTTQQAHLYDRMRPKPRDLEALGPGVIGDLEIEFPLPERVLAEIDEIQQVYPKNFQAGLDRSAKYTPYIRSELAKAGLPQDLVWLAMVESHFTEKITSPAGAGGMWQFMRTTGRHYGLRIDWEVDERFHWQKSTRTAIAYLSALYEMFEDWPLAISAYNMGEHGLERAIAANGGERDLWRLLDTPPASYRIRRETKKFYPKLLATIIVASSPERYGFKVDGLPPDSTASVTTNGPYSLSELDRACGLPSGTLRRLNPHLLRGATPQTPYEITVPADIRSKMVAALKKIPQVRYASSGGPGGTHIVRRGETISHIAKRYHVSQRELTRINNVRFAHRLQVGRKLIIPGGGVGGGLGAVTIEEGRRVYKVKRGDSLYEIAKAEKVTVADLQAWNHLGKRSRIYVGQSLYVSPPGQRVPEKPSDATTPTKLVHVVRAGEYPAKIARRYGVDLDDFLRWNNLTKSSTIRVGDKLVVYKDGPSEPSGTASKSTVGQRPTPNAAQPPHTAKKVHKVVKGDNPSVIAAKYGVKTSNFLAWNGLTTRSVLHIGDEYVVYVPEDSPEQGSKDLSEPEKEPDDAKEQEPEKIVHVVAKGQNPTTIARRYGVRLSQLFEWNGWKKAPLLHIGDEVVIYK